MHLNWSDRHTMPVASAGGVAGQLDGRVIYAGGTTWTAGVKHWLQDVMVYDPASDQWTSGPRLPKPLAYGAGLHYEGGVEILGGTDGEKTYRECWRLTSLKGRWQLAGSIPTNTLLGRAERVNGRTYVFGGCSDVADLTRCNDTAWVRETDGGWRQVSSLPQGAVAMPAAAAVHGRVFLFGGCSMKTAGALVNRDDAYSFDAAAGQWKHLRPLPKASRGMTATAFSDRYILLAGGYTATQAEAVGKPVDFGFTSDVWVYDTQADSYSNAGSLPFATAGIELVPHSGTIFGVGGEHRMRDRSNRLLAATIPRN